MQLKIKKVSKLRNGTDMHSTKYVEVKDPIPCDIVGTDGSRTGFFSIKSAKRALVGLIQTLPKRKPGEAKRFTIEKQPSRDD